MNTTLQTMLKPTEGSTPEQQMLHLGDLSKQCMASRVKAQRNGLNAIHDAYCELHDVIIKEQKELLAAHPELVLMAL